MVTITGTIGNDTLNGTRRDDLINGLSGDDTVFGGAGNDTINGGDGQDTIDGGVGNDLIDGGNDGDYITGGEGNDVIYTGAGGFFFDQITDGAGDDEVYGGLDTQIFIGSAGNDYYDGGNGEGLGLDLDIVDYRDALAGIIVDLRLSTGQVRSAGTTDAARIGVDTLLNFEAVSGSAFDDLMSGGAASDSLSGAAGNDLLNGGAGFDTLSGGEGDDTIDGGEDRDYASYSGSLVGVVVSLMIAGAQVTGQGSDTLTNIENLEGSRHDDILIGNDGANALFGNEGDDRLFGNGGSDFLYGDLGTGNYLDGGTGADRMYGGSGDDVYIVDDTKDVTEEGLAGGTDVVRSSVSYSLDGAEIRFELENLTLTGLVAIDGTGNALANMLRGNSAANKLTGLEGNDKLYGNAGNDTLQGGDGDDWLFGGVGRDLAYGGNGVDRFSFDDGEFGGASNATCDRLFDFAGSDLIYLRNADANSLVTGDQNFRFLGVAGFTGSAGELRYQQISGNTYVQGDTDGDGKADFWIRIDGLHALNVRDFIL